MDCSAASWLFAALFSLAQSSSLDLMCIIRYPTSYKTISKKVVGGMIMSGASDYYPPDENEVQKQEQAVTS